MGAGKGAEMAPKSAKFNVYVPQISNILMPIDRYGNSPLLVLNKICTAHAEVLPNAHKESDIILQNLTVNFRGGDIHDSLFTKKELI